MSRRKWFQALVGTVVAVCLLALAGVASAQGNSANAFERVKEVQERHTGELMVRPGVVGTAVGLSEQQGEYVVLVLLDRPGVAVPREFEGVSVRPLVTGAIEALPKGGKSGRGKPGGGGSTLSPTSRWQRPVPIGVSTGNALSNSAGTISCRVTDGSTVYALSNNHVYALENTAPFGSEVLQPGVYDGGIPNTDHLGNLSAFVSIVFSTSASNTVDAAIAATTTELLGTATPSNGYGVPNATTLAADVGMAVQKYGRTTSLTKGTVTGINAVINVGYSSGTARFINQIVVQSNSPFIKAGDSGSLLVTNDQSKNPVGLLFAGNNSGKYAVANPIDLVLSAFGVTIDGQ